MSFFKEYYDEDILDFQRVHISEYKQFFLIKNNFAFSTINRKLSSLSIYEDFLIEKGIRKSQTKVIKKFDFYLFFVFFNYPVISGLYVKYQNVFKNPENNCGLCLEYSQQPSFKFRIN